MKSERVTRRQLRVFFFFQAEDGIRDLTVTGVQTCALPISAAITGAYVAMSLAVRKLTAEGKLSENPLLYPVAAVSVGIVAKRVLLDLSYIEDAAAQVDMNLVMNSAGEFIEVQGTGEEATFSQDQLSEMLEVGHGGIRDLLTAQQAALT